MKRTWVTGSAHDDKPLDWLFDLRHNDDVSHMTEALEAVTNDEDASIGAWQTALLVAECVACLRGGKADLHEDAVAWLQKVKPVLTDENVALTEKVVATARTNSALQRWWREFKAEDMAVWQRAVAYLGRRVKDGIDATM